jgi:hypothetical protein
VLAFCGCCVSRSARRAALTEPLVAEAADEDEDSSDDEGYRR